MSNILLLMTPTSSGPLEDGLHIVDTAILDASNQEVVFTGFDGRGLFGFLMYPLESFYNASNMKFVREHGFNYFRTDIALDMATRDQAISTPTSINYNQSFWDKIDEIVDETVVQGLWLCIDFGVSDGCWSPLNENWGLGNGFPPWVYNGSWGSYNTSYANTTSGKVDAIRDFYNTDNHSADNVREIYQTFWKDIATRYKDYKNVIFDPFNEPMNVAGAGSLWDNQSAWDHQMVMFKGFMENLIDEIRTIDDGNHIIEINTAYCWNWEENLKINRSGVYYSPHTYTNSNISSTIASLADLGWRYNQPVSIGEYGGIEGGLQTRASAITTMQICNMSRIGRAYLNYNPSSTGGIQLLGQTLIDLEDNNRSTVVFYNPP